jgi:hypothetical protein
VTAHRPYPIDYDRGPQMPDQHIVVNAKTLTMFERALNVFKNLVVIFTCVIVLYVVYRVYVALVEFSERMSQISDAATTGNLFGG